ncbi:contractile injection system protein, VgrG/Pvc8 family [uncultured Paracoccus sp.]|uniref:contractile injection system protein, VgrG/Pvc8 family n=1 Tax=uncultured Paracoccus sp. TaxID=189685 RepID=UPI0025E41CA2|nr:contractile injection system protein, VgrG/Pvc8 family [uncultured Paracoccus sp.]
MQILLAPGGLLGQLPFPRPGAEIRLTLGRGVSAGDMGLFIADEFEFTTPPASFAIRARAAMFDGTKGGREALQSAKRRSWPAGTTIGDMVATVAADHGLRALTGPSVASVALDHINQLDESDLNLLLRIARDNDAFVKPGNGSIIVAKKGESVSASGAALPVVTLSPGDLTSCTLRRSSRETPKSCIASWRDVAAAITREEKAGSGTPELRLRQHFGSAAAAQKAAQAALDRGKRGEKTLSVSLPGRIDIMAESRIIMPPLQPDLAGEWLVTRVQHNLSAGSGWAMSIEAEQV